MAIERKQIKPELFYAKSVAAIDQVPTAPSQVRKPTGLLDRLMQADNTAPWRVTRTNVLPGKTAPSGSAGVNEVEVILEYQKPFCEGGESVPATKICDVTGSTTEQRGWLNIDIDNVAERHFLLNIEDFNNLAEGPQERLAEMLRRKAFEIKHEINRKAIEELYANINNYVDGTAGMGATLKRTNVISNDGKILNAGFVRILQEYRQAYYTGDVINVSGEVMANYFLAKQLEGMISRTNDPGAAMVAIERLMGFTYDVSLDPVIQDLENDTKSHGITLPVGGMIMHDWQENEGDRAARFDDHLRTTINIDGINYDYFLHFDKCDFVWKVMLKKTYAFGVIPATEYCNGQGLIFHWHFGTGDYIP